MSLKKFKRSATTKYQLVVPVFILFLFALGGCQAQTPQVVKIGLVAPFEGQDREIGYDGIYAARLAVREFNAEQLAENKPLRVALVALDDSGNVDIAAGNAQALAADPSIIAIVGMGNEPTRLATAENLTNSSISFLHVGVSPFKATSPDQLPDDFKSRYETVTPFDEVAGDQAGSVYDAFKLIFAGIDQLDQENRPVTAKNLAEISKSVTIQGIAGDTLQWDQ